MSAVQSRPCPPSPLGFRPPSYSRLRGQRVKHRLDLFGILVLSFAAATFGGIGRDVLIGSIRPAALDDWRSIAVSLFAGVTVFFSISAPARFQTPVLVLDGAGLGFFAVSGALKALACGLTPMMKIWGPSESPVSHW